MTGTVTPHAEAVLKSTAKLISRSLKSWLFLSTANQLLASSGTEALGNRPKVLSKLLVKADLFREQRSSFDGLLG